MKAGNFPEELIVTKILPVLSNFSQFLRISINSIYAGQNFILCLKRASVCMKQITIQMLSIKAISLQEGSLLAPMIK